jgi:hypothetical protein
MGEASHHIYGLKPKFHTKETIRLDALRREIRTVRAELLPPCHTRRSVAARGFPDGNGPSAAAVEKASTQ